MSQLAFLGIPTQQIVNVASVKHRSPFRYPGGKTWLVPRVFNWLSRIKRPKEYIEPFAGGAIVGLTVAFENLADHVTLVELDDQVACVWKAILTDDEGEWLAKRIEKFSCTEQNVQKLLSLEYSSIRERAFQTIVQNRTAHGGILAKGAGLVKNGENGKGLSSRWYPETLARRIRDIRGIRDRITFVHGDAFDIIEKNRDRTGVAWFVDPPYTAGKGKRAGTRLYSHFDIDHEKLFKQLAGAVGDVLITYDRDDHVEQLASEHGFRFAPVAMQNTHLAKVSELLIGKNLDWLSR